MKKYIFLSMLMLLATIGFSQRIEVFKTAGGIVQDTVTNTGNKVLVSSNAPQFYDILAVQVNVTKVSGTVGGNIILQGSIDGSNWVNVDTVTAANVDSQALLMVVREYPYAYLRTSYTGTGTMVAVFRTRGLYKRRGL